MLESGLDNLLEVSLGLDLRDNGLARDPPFPHDREHAGLNQVRVMLEAVDVDKLRSRHFNNCVQLGESSSERASSHDIARDDYVVVIFGLNINPSLHIHEADAGKFALELTSAGRKIPGQDVSWRSVERAPQHPSTRYPHLYHRQSSLPAAAKRVDIGARATTRCFSRKSAINQLLPSSLRVLPPRVRRSQSCNG